MSRAVGADAERRAAEHLQRSGFRILARNWTCRGGELDLVCDDGGTLVFVEVRARASARWGTPAETVDARKRRRLVHAAQQFLSRHDLHDRPCRFDLVTFEGDRLEHLVDVLRLG